MLVLMRPVRPMDVGMGYRRVDVMVFMRFLRVSFLMDVTVLIIVAVLVGMSHTLMGVTKAPGLAVEQEDSHQHECSSEPVGSRRALSQQDD
jgi:hypothetical protein